MCDTGKSCYINSIIEQIHKEIKPGNQVLGKMRECYKKQVLMNWKECMILLKDLE